MRTIWRAADSWTQSQGVSPPSGRQYLESRRRHCYHNRQETGTTRETDFDDKCHNRASTWQACCKLGESLRVRRKRPHDRKPGNQ